MKKLYFIRHGLSENNKLGRFTGHFDSPLADEGREQARQAGKKAKDINIDLIISSPLSRALETAKIVAKEMSYPEAKIQINPLLIERNYGAIENQLYAPDIDMDSVADIETTDELLARGGEILDSLRRTKEDDILIVCHGSIGRAIRHHLFSDQPFDPNGHVPNAEIIQWI